jgi:hypothetical protein
MADLSGRKVFKVFNQDFIVDERYTVTKELGQGAYGIVWYATPPLLLVYNPLGRSIASSILSAILGYDEKVQMLKISTNQ